MVFKNEIINSSVSTVCEYSPVHSFETAQNNKHGIIGGLGKVSFFEK